MELKKSTPIPALNKTLNQLLDNVCELLGDNFVGAYLQGSFATGDFTEYSDVDVLIVIERDLSESEIQPFQELHKKLFHELPHPWGQRIELSYTPASILRRKTETPRDPPDLQRSKDWIDPSMNTPPTAYPFWYLDNGANRLVRSEHDNSNIVRWVTREKGITLLGPDPKILIDPVSPKDLRNCIVKILRFVNEKWASKEAINSRMLQTFFVTLCVRALHSIVTGTVASKKTATEWAIENMNSKWHPLIKSAWSEWQERREQLCEDADQLSVEQTVSLIRYVLERSELLT